MPSAERCNIGPRSDVYAVGRAVVDRSSQLSWVCEMQRAHPGDLGALALVIGVFVTLLVVTLMFSTPT